MQVSNHIKWYQTDDLVLFQASPSRFASICRHITLTVWILLLHCTTGHICTSDRRPAFAAPWLFEVRKRPGRCQRAQSQLQTSSNTLLCMACPLKGSVIWSTLSATNDHIYPHISPVSFKTSNTSWWSIGVFPILFPLWRTSHCRNKHGPMEIWQPHKAREGWRSRTGLLSLIFGNHSFSLKDLLQICESSSSLANAAQGCEPVQDIFRDTYKVYDVLTKPCCFSKEGLQATGTSAPYHVGGNTLWGEWS